MITLVLHSVVGPGILLSLLVLHPRAALAQTAPLESAALPANIRVSPLLESTVSTLLRKSKTFARQCARIGEARFTRLLLVATPPPRDLLTPRARSYITRHVYGGLRAIVQVPLTAEQAELIAHEFEHVIEQIEGLDLVALARSGGDAVVEVEEGVYETVRARAAGLTVAAEAHGEAAASERVKKLLRAIRSRATHDATRPTSLSRP